MPRRKITDIERTREIDSLMGSIDKMTKANIVKKGEEGTETALSKMMSATTRIIKKVGDVLGETAKVPVRLAGDLREAIAEDFKVEKKSLTYMAANVGPLSGYFLSKVMETDTFKRSINAFKEKISGTFSFVADKFKEKVSSTAESVKGTLRNVYEKVGDFFTFGKKKKKVKVPKMAKGGYVKKGGLARLHAGEVVMPIEKALRELDEGGGSRSDRKLAKLFKAISDEQRMSIISYAKTSRRENAKSLYVALRKAEAKSFPQYQQPLLDKIAAGLEDLKITLLDLSKKAMFNLGEMWEKFLEKHPIIRGFTIVSKILFKTLSFPLKVLFHKWGKPWYYYLVSRSKNPFVATAQNTASFFPLFAGQIDNLNSVLQQQLYVLKDVGSALTGKKYPKHAFQKLFYRWSLIGLLSKGLWGVTKETGKGLSFLARFAAREITGRREVLKGAERKPVGLLGRIKGILRKGKEEEVPEEGKSVLKSNFDLMISILRKILFRLEIIARRIVPIDLYKRLLDREETFIDKLLGIEKENLEFQVKSSSKLKDVFKEIKVSVQDQIESLKDMKEDIKNEIKTSSESAVDSFIKNTDKLENAVDKVKISIQDQIEVTRNMDNSVGRGLDKILVESKRSKNWMSEHLGKPLKKGFGKVSEGLGKVKDKIKDASKSFLERIWDFIVGIFMFGKNLVGKITGGLTSLFGEKSILLGKIGMMALSLEAIAFAVGSIYSMINAQSKYGDPLGEKLTTAQKIGLGLSGGVAMVTGGAIAGEAGIAAENLRMAQAAKTETDKMLYERIKSLVGTKISKDAFDVIAAGGEKGFGDRMTRLIGENKVIEFRGQYISKKEADELRDKALRERQRISQIEYAKLKAEKIKEATEAAYKKGKEEFVKARYSRPAVETEKRLQKYFKEMMESEQAEKAEGVLRKAGKKLTEARYSRTVVQAEKAWEKAYKETVESEKFKKAKEKLEKSKEKAKEKIEKGKQRLTEERYSRSVMEAEKKAKKVIKQTGDYWKDLGEKALKSEKLSGVEDKLRKEQKKVTTAIKVQQTRAKALLKDTELTKVQIEKDILELKQKGIANKRMVEGVEESKKANAIMINNYSKISNAISNSTKNATTGSTEPSQTFFDAYLDSIFKGDIP